MTIYRKLILERKTDEQSLHPSYDSRSAKSSRAGESIERLSPWGGARRAAQAARGSLRRALLALLIGSVALTGTAADAAGPGASAPGAAPAISAAGASQEQPQSWLLKWATPEQARELRGVEVLHRQREAAVDVVRPARGCGEDVEAWLHRLRGEPGVVYVHPNQEVRMLSLEPSGGSEGGFHAGAGNEDADAAVKPLSINADKSLSMVNSTATADKSLSTGDSKANVAIAGNLQDGVPGADEEPGDDPVPRVEPSTSSSDDVDGEMTPPGLQHVETPPTPDEPQSDEPASDEPDSADKLQARATAFRANDPELAKQQHLVQIGALKAWETVRAQTDITIALIDTGVDLEHPDLIDNLVPGINLVNPKLPPMDDNGHGTSVAGVIAAAGNNEVGVAGILWQAKLMPIKALDRWGDGTEKDLGEAILQAVRGGAKIVVLSVGLHRYSPYMLDIVQYAESQGVLLVAAVGNDGASLGSKAEVKYPAAYPTVLAVGGATAGNQPDTRSNPGPELDLLAPWNVYTTALGGTYKKEEGTSMAAPQVAAAAALVMARNPSYKPAQVRALLRQTARDIGQPGVDRTSGYGILQLDKAVTAELASDAYEPNNSSASAAAYPLNTGISAELTAPNDDDWYVIDAPHAGKLTLHYEGYPTSGQSAPVVRISHYTDGRLQRAQDIKLSSGTIDFQVAKGKQHMLVQFAGASNRHSLLYSLTNSFTMAADAYEPNDRHTSAYSLEPKSQTVTGNFHQQADRDWFVVQFDRGGQLQLSLSTDTVRIDPGLALQREGQSLSLYDDRGEGATEQTPVISVTPGKYYIRVHNAISTDASPTVGTYTLTMNFNPRLTDPNEPNDKSYEALMMSGGTEYVGVIDHAADIDWFQFRIANQSYVSLNVSGVPGDVSLKLEGYDKRMALVASGSTGADGKLQTKDQLLEPGVYYVKLTANKAFDHTYYRLQLSVQELVSGFRDVKGHWAETEIVSLAGQGIVNGVGNHIFAPERAITRAEAVAMIVKAYKPAGSALNASRFHDVSQAHWANDAIARAVRQGWVQGFPDGSFRPDRPITRAEMASIIGKAEGIQTRVPVVRPFADVSPYDWHAPMLFAMKEEGRLKGVEPDRFKPNDNASRAQFTVLLHRYYMKG